MKILEKYVVDIISQYPLLFIIIIIISWWLTFSKILNLIIEVKKLVLEISQTHKEKILENKKCIEDLEQKMNEHDQISKDKYNLISEKFSDKLGNSLSLLIDRLNQNKNKLGQILSLLENS